MLPNHENKNIFKTFNKLKKMVKLTTQYLFRKISSKNQLLHKKKDETDLEYLQRVTHLHLQSQFIDKISSIPECESVTVIYLQNNLLRSIQNMENFPNLTHLYLQHNFITKIENLDKCRYLKKLYLGNNEISVVEGLDKLVNLTELHLESQRLPQGETLYFDPLSIAQLRNSLKVLNVANNNLTSMGGLGDLVCLNKLLLKNNQINDLDEVTETLVRLPALEILSMEDNPVVLNRKYFDAVISSTRSLTSLNGREINEKTKDFVTKLEFNKALREKVSGLSTKAFKSSKSFPQTAKPSFEEMVSKSSTLFGSKLFPVLKTVVNNQKKTRPSLVSVYKNSLSVSPMPSSADYFT